MDVTVAPFSTPEHDPGTAPLRMPGGDPAAVGGEGQPAGGRVVWVGRGAVGEQGGASGKRPGGGEASTMAAACRNAPSGQLRDVAPVLSVVKRDLLCRPDAPHRIQSRIV